MGMSFTRSVAALRTSVCCCALSGSPSRAGVRPRAMLIASWLSAVSTRELKVVSDASSCCRTGLGRVASRSAWLTLGGGSDRSSGLTPFPLACHPALPTGGWGAGPVVGVVFEVALVEVVRGVDGLPIPVTGMVPP